MLLNGSSFVLLANMPYFLFSQGANASALEKEIGPEQFPVNEHYFGLVNVSEFCVLGVGLYSVTPACLHHWVLSHVSVGDIAGAEVEETQIRALRHTDNS